MHHMENVLIRAIREGELLDSEEWSLLYWRSRFHEMVEEYAYQPGVAIQAINPHLGEVLAEHFVIDEEGGHNYVEYIHYEGEG